MGFPFRLSEPDDDRIRELLGKSPLISNWYKSLGSECRVKKADVISVDCWGGRVGILEMDVQYELNGREYADRIVLTGRSVMMCMLLRAEETGKLYTVLVKQPRIGSGRLMYEFPAGKTEDSTEYLDVAAREVREEVGIPCRPEDLVYIPDVLPNGDDTVMVAAPYFDERVRFYCYSRTMKTEDIMKLEGKSHGVDPDEQITLHICLFDDLLKYVTDPSTLACCFRVRQLLTRGLI
jgi:8-oxo-dGTP pyrophosphatase MutT (NUDIX family)